MVRLRSIGVFSCAKLFAVLQAVIGVLIGFVFLFIGIVGAAIAPGRQRFGMIGIIVIAVLMPVFYAVLGFVMGAIWAFVYNLAADSMGGLELEFETMAAPAFPASPQSASA